MTDSMARRALFSLAGASIALSAFSAPTAAEPEEIIFNVFIPRPAPLYKNGLEPWAREVEAASNGTLKITIPTSSLAPTARQYDLVQDGVADMSVAPLAFRDKQLSLYMIGAIPLIAESAVGASVALWDTHEKFLAGAGQWQEFVPLTLFTLGAPSIVSNAHPILSKDDLDGFKVLAVGKEKITTWRNLGASPVGGSGQRPFEILSSGVADGATNPLGTAVTQGLLEASKHVTLVPGRHGRTRGLHRLHQPRAVRRSAGRGAKRLAGDVRRRAGGEAGRDHGQPRRVRPEEVHRRRNRREHCIAGIRGRDIRCR